MPLVKELALQWWEERQRELDWQEQAQTFDFLERYLLRFLGEEELTTLTQARMDAYFTQLLFEQTYRNPTDRKQVMYGKPILQGIFDYAIRRGAACSLPKADLSFRLNIKTKTAPVGCDFEEETIGQIQYLIACEESTLTGLALGLAYYAGFNREEILSLRRSHVDLMRRRLFHTDGRAVALAEPLEHMLHRHLQQELEAEDRLLFVSKRKTPFAGPSLSHLVKLAKEKHGVDHQDIGLNALRNQYILYQLNTITSDALPALAAGLGASPINLINTFGHFLVPAKRETYAVAGMV